MRIPALCRNRSRSAPSPIRRARPQLELLEDRTVPSADGLPAISGAFVTPEGALYTLNLDAAGHAVDFWTVTWGDGSAAETLPGSATQASHLYADGPLACTISVSATDHTPLALVQWTASAGGNGHYYSLTSSAETWTQAENEAQSSDGHLASITSLAEQSFLTGTFLSGSHDHRILWIGINDAAVEGQYVWSTGEPVAYTNWQSGEPNNFKGVEDYGAINWHFGHNVPGGVFGSWNDTPLDGFNSNATGPEPWVGLMEFNALPEGAVTARSLQVSVQNVGPNASLSGPASAVRGQTLTFTLGANDPSQPDQYAGFTYSIDWNGDGKADQAVKGGAGTQVSHTFAASGSYNATVTATDRDGGTGLAAVQAVSVTAAAIQNGTLVVGGTSDDDSILLFKEGQTGVRVQINGQNEGVFNPTSGVVIHGYAGNDIIAVRGYKGAVQMCGDEGNDLLVAGPGHTEVFGGPGDDLVIGARGNERLVLDSADFLSASRNLSDEVVDRIFAEQSPGKNLAFLKDHSPHC